MKDLISVIVPIFNRGEMVADCINSILNNTYRNLEIILVNDGSTDNTLEVLNKYEKIDNRIIIVDKENGGVSDARNAGLDIAKGEWIAFIDSDDWISNTYFEKLISATENAYVNMVVCNYVIVSEHILNNNVELNNSKNCRYINGLEVIKHHATRDFIWGRIYRRELIKDIRFKTDVKFAEDTLFNFTILSKKSNNIKCYYIEEKLYFYYKNPQGGTQLINDGRGLPPLLDSIYELVDLMPDIEQKNNNKKCV